MLSLLIKSYLPKLRPCSFIVSKRCVSSSLTQENEAPQLELPDYVDLGLCPAWDSNDNKITTIKNNLIRDMTVLTDFVSQEEETAFFSELEPYLKRMRYEFDHWDDAIHGFRETERSVWKGLAAEACQRAREVALPPPAIPLPHMHVLDLDAKGFIKPHVDAIRFCGSTVAGICLLSPAIMRLRHSIEQDLFADFLLSRRCLYIMTGTSRYDFSHEILKGEISQFKNEQVQRTRRISVICRSQPDPVNNK